MGEALMPRRGGGIKAHGFVEGSGDVLQFGAPLVVKFGCIRLVDPVEDVVVIASDTAGGPYTDIGVVITEVVFTGTGEPPTGPAINSSIDGVCRTNCLVKHSENHEGSYSICDIYGGMFLLWDEEGGLSGSTGVSLMHGSFEAGSASGPAYFNGTYEYFIFE